MKCEAYAERTMDLKEYTEKVKSQNNLPKDVFK